ncbi:DUF4303 domain-containing protein [Paenibacillus sp. BC26]|uniref:DUF4303 domain-containing protein n=1 Tax=Paenibacillus sp. BC26 TaxID=1881032 RepID=UPI0008EAD830|nr:hypothetical protein [Paenibacillus sp. BC26]SFS77305.1 hypothetical protein SAMN05428962_2776 [Paenibacillus sp. BC26]
MTNAIDFAILKMMLIQHGEQTIRDFAITSQNKDVYAFVLDAQATYGVVNFKWNTLEGFAYTRTFNRYKDYPDDRLYGHRGLKYSIGDFRFEDARNEKLEKWGMKYEEALEVLWETEEEEAEQAPNGFMAVLTEVIKELTPAFGQLHLTDDFIAYAVDHDGDDMKYLPETVDPAQLDKAFPELKAYEVYKAKLCTRLPVEQAEFWCQTFTDFVEGHESEAVVELRRYSRYSFDAKEELVKLGEVSVPILVTFLERALRHLPVSTDGGDPRKAWNYQSVILEIAKAGESEINRLQAIYARQKSEYPEEQDTKNTLRVLHAIDSKRFPE